MNDVLVSVFMRESVFVLEYVYKKWEGGRISTRQ